MSYVLRSAFRRLFFTSIDIPLCTHRNAFLAYNYPSTRPLMFSRLTYSQDKRSNNEQNVPAEGSNSKLNLQKQLIRLETNITKRGMVLLDELNGILSTLETKKSLSSPLAMKLMCCCGELLAHEPPLTRVLLVQKMWDTFSGYGVQYNITHYNALLKVYTENNYPFNPDEIMKEIKARELTPDADTYRFFISKYCHKGDLVNTNRLLRKMREENLPIAVDIYRSLIICHSKNDKMEDAEHVIEVVAKMEPDAQPAVYSTLIIEYIRKGCVKKALEIFDLVLQNHRYKLNEYFDILYELAVHDHEDEFHRKLQEYRHPSNYNLKVPVYITKLIAAGKSDYAYAILRTMHQLTKPTGTRVALGPFFVASLVKYNVSCNEIVKLCLDMMKTKFNELALQIAMHESLRMQKEKLALNLFHAARYNNLPIRIHYFWPLLLNRARNKDTDGVFYLLDIMYNNYNLPANSETLRFYIIPYIYSKTMNITTFMNKFKPYGVTISTVVCALVHHLLMQQEFQRAAEIAETYGASYPKDRYEKITVDMYVKTKDSNSFIKLMKAYCMGSLWYQTQSRPEEVDFYDHRNFFNTMVYTAIEKLIKEKDGTKYVAELIQCMLKNNISITPKKCDMIKGLLFDHEMLNDELSNLLDQLKLAKITTESRTDDFGVSLSSVNLYTHLHRLYGSNNICSPSTAPMKLKNGTELVLIYADCVSSSQNSCPFSETLSEEQVCAPILDL